jgi:dihydroorotase
MEITIWRPNDMHAHVREGRMLEIVLPFTARHFAHVVIMPNTTQPVLTGADAQKYRTVIASKTDQFPSFAPLMTIKITPKTTVKIIKDAKRSNVMIGKLYPDGVTTNSAGGVRDFTVMDPVFQTMQDAGMVLCLHGEKPGAFSMDREDAFLVELGRIAKQFPKLRIVFEHVSSSRAVTAIQSLPENVAATITVHHLVLSLDDVIGGNLNPHAFCKPIPKRPVDRKALRDAAFSGSSKFFLGTDSAPHPPQHKVWPEIRPGVFTAPVAIGLLVDLFGEDRLDQLRAFTVHNSAKFYELPVLLNSTNPLKLIRTPWVVPKDYSDIVPIMPGGTINWQVVEA